DPMLAFAARSTSSFPLAFEPMTLDDIVEQEPRPRQAELKDKVDTWGRKVLGMPMKDSHERMSHRAFGDGGYLDNKPFGFTIDTLALRKADTLVDRKLVYVEPAPEHPEIEPEADQRPNAFENLVLAATVLPRVETIREDLVRLRLRNRLIERIL